MPIVLCVDLLPLHSTKQRDIRQDEELFLDYGPEWEAAWERHVQEWAPPPNAEDYVYPADMDLTKPFKTLDEQEKDPYPNNLQTVCQTSRWNYRRERGKVSRWTEPRYPLPIGLTNCYILARNKDGRTGDYTYDVALEFENDHPTVTQTTSKDKLYQEAGVPQRAILVRLTSLCGLACESFIHDCIRSHHCLLFLRPCA